MGGLAVFGTFMSTPTVNGKSKVRTNLGGNLLTQNRLLLLLLRIGVTFLGVLSRVVVHGGKVASSGSGKVRKVPE